MDMYEQLVTFRDSYVPDLLDEPAAKPFAKAKPLSTRQIIRKTLYLTRTKKKLLGEGII
jgi:hypothetical protein